MDEWPDAGEARGTDAAITSVASWRGAYGPVEHEGTTYTLRVHEFRKFASLPADGRAVSRWRSISIRRTRKTSSCWRPTAGRWWSRAALRAIRGRIATTSSARRRKVMIAKGMHVQTGSGWFSDRSICYLASGRPVLAQDAGLGDLLPLGDGLLTFTTVGEAVEAAREIDRDYAHHARAARRVALGVSESSTVLGALDEEVEPVLNPPLIVVAGALANKPGQRRRRLDASELGARTEASRMRRLLRRGDRRSHVHGLGARLVCARHRLVRTRGHVGSRSPRRTGAPCVPARRPARVSA